MAASNKIIDATLRFQDRFTGSMGKSIKKIEEQQARLNKISGNMNKIGKSITRTGKTLTTNITAPVVGLGAVAVKTAADFESGMSKVQAISGQVADKDLPGIEKAAQKMGLNYKKGLDSTGTAMNILSEKAKEMGAKTKFSATESAEAFSYMAMAGWKTADMLDGIEGVMYLAGATGEDLATTSDIVTDALTAFGLKASDTNHFVDVLAKASSNANTNVSMMGETFKYVAPVAGSLGYSVDDMAVAIGLMANSGIKASKAGTSLRSMLTNLAKPSKSVQAAMDALDLSMTNSDGTMKDFSTLMTELRGKFSGLTEAQKASYAATLAGKTGMSGLLAIVNSSDKDFDALTNSIQNSTGAAQEMYNVANDNLNGKLTVLKSTVESIAISFGEKLSPYIGKATEFLQKLSDKVNNLSDDQIDMIVKIAGVAAAVGPVLLVIGKVFTIGGKLVKGIKTVKNVLGVAKGAMAALSPTGLIVIGVIAALAAVAFVVYKNWDKIKPVLMKVWEKIKEICGKMKEKYLSIKEKVTSLVALAVEKFTAIKEKVKGIFTSIVSAIKAPLNSVISLINSVIDKVNSISVSIPEWVPVVGGKTFGANIPHIPMLYSGTDFFSGGVASINEKGGEIIDLPRGSRVIPHDKSVSEAYKTGRSAGSKNINIAKLADTIVVREDADIDKIAEEIAKKLEEADDNAA